LVKESEVNPTLGELQMTRIIIAHHPETIAAADRVLRLERGRVLRSEPAEPSLLGAA
jgi:ATP-binding cassette subfamily B protein RaxB